MPETSLASRRKFSVDKTQRLTAGIDSSSHQRSMSSSFRAPSAYASSGSTNPRSSAYRRVLARGGAGGRGGGGAPRPRRGGRPRRVEEEEEIKHSRSSGPRHPRGRAGEKRKLGGRY